MELRQLRYFVAIAEVENFRLAAERLAVAQPALSRQISNLEKELGTLLFERLPRGVRLSHAGRRFMTEAKAILAQLDQASERAKRADKGYSGSLQVTFSVVGSAHGVAPACIDAFRVAAPQVELTLRPMSSALQVEALRNREVDAAFLYLKPESWAEFGHLQLSADNVLLAIPSHHALARCREIRLAHLVDQPLIRIYPGVNPPFYDAFTSAFGRAGVTLRFTEEASNGAHVMILVSLGFGLGLVSAAEQYERPIGVVLKPIRGLKVPSSFNLAWRRDNSAPALPLLIEVAKEVAARSQPIHGLRDQQAYP